MVVINGLAKGLLVGVARFVVPAVGMTSLAAVPLGVHFSALLIRLTSKVGTDFFFTADAVAVEANGYCWAKVGFFVTV